MKNICLSVALVLLLGPGAVTASAQQSQSDLRRDNQRLRSEVEDLTRELDALRTELQRLREENTRLQRQLAAAPASNQPTTPGTAAPPLPPAPVVSIDESKPNASPRALLWSLTESYRASMADAPVGDSPASNERISFLRKLDRWSSRVNREFKAAVEWHVEVIGLPVVAGRGFTLRLQAVDPVTAATLGDPFDAFLPRTVVNRLQQIEQREGLDQTLVMKGVLVPRVHVNEDRTEAGPFDNPRFIGAFAEFDFNVDVMNLRPRKN